MSRLRMLQILIATVFLSAGLAVVPIMAAGTTRRLPEKSATPCVAPSTQRACPSSLCSCMRAEGRQVRLGCR